MGPLDHSAPRLWIGRGDRDRDRAQERPAPEGEPSDSLYSIVELCVLASDTSIARNASKTRRVRCRFQLATNNSQPTCRGSPVDVSTNVFAQQRTAIPRSMCATATLSLSLGIFRSAITYILGHKPIERFIAHVHHDRFRLRIFSQCVPPVLPPQTRILRQSDFSNDIACEVEIHIFLTFIPPQGEDGSFL